MSEAGDRWRREHPERVRAAKQRYAEKHRGEPRKPKPRTCKVCGSAFDHAWRQTCSDKCESIIASRTMASTNREHASARMKVHNPMREAETRKRVSETLRKIGHRPPVRGGNGKVMPAPVRELLAFLPEFLPELSIRTGKPRGGGYPGSYKVDLGFAPRKIAIEADGSSHTGGRLIEDRKKDALLASLGWIVLRFKNAAIMEDPRACAECAKAAR